MRELLLESSDISRRREITDILNSRPNEFESLLDEIFSPSEKGYSREKKQVLDFVDFLIPRLAVLVVERAVTDSDDRVRVRGLQATYRGQFNSLNGKVLDILQNSDEPFEVRKWAVHILGGTDPVSFGRYLRKIVRDSKEDIEIRKEAIFALTNSPSNPTIGALCMLLGDSDVDIRQAGAWALGKVESDDAINCLLAALEDEDESVRDWAIRGLRDSDNARALQGLADAMTSVEPLYQRQLIRLVVEKRSEIILRAIVELLEATDVEVRRLAAWAMGVSPYPPAAGELEKLLDDQDEQVRVYARKALERLGHLDPTDFGLML
ncbi:MAG: HEAT repeat domain-containing protein [Candidatus Thorarchaeota archaeon]